MIDNFTCLKNENGNLSFSQLYNRKDDEFKIKQLIVSTNITIFLVNDLLKEKKPNETILEKTKKLFDEYLRKDFSNKDEKFKYLTTLKTNFEELEQKLKNEYKLSY